ncbi:MAG: shikimate kinase [Lachnospiraceae bacterium]|jgi:shikimate kinase|nr:shikimate kinase [Lachnospiraceae bacterium]
MKSMVSGLYCEESRLTDSVNMKRAIVLIGFMGSGKTVIGKRLAKHFHCPFIDTDRLIEDNEGQAIADIFAVKGEEHFRQLESACLETLLAGAKERRVIATGGGMPVRAENRLLLKQLGTVVYLQAEAAALYEHVKHSTTRPLLKTADPQATIAALLEEREPIYREVADCVIETGGKSIEQIVKEITREAL